MKKKFKRFSSFFFFEKKYTTTNMHKLVILLLTTLYKPKTCFKLLGWNGQLSYLLMFKNNIMKHCIYMLPRISHQIYLFIKNMNYICKYHNIIIRVY